MLRKLLSALFGMSVVQSPDAIQNEKMETVVQEQIIEIEENNKGSDLIVLEKEMTIKRLQEQQSFAEHTNVDHNCKKCPLHCFSNKKSEWNSFKSYQKDWLSDKMQYLKVEMLKVKNKLFQSFDKMKSKTQEFIDKKREYSPQDESRNKFRSR